MGRELTREGVESAHRWEAVDRVAGALAMTAFRRLLRLQQAERREAAGHPIGTSRSSRRTTPRLLGSRLPLAYDIDAKANFLTEGAADAAVDRLGSAEPVGR